MIEDFVYRLGKRAAQKVFSLADPLSLAEVLVEEFSIEEMERFWKNFGEPLVIPEGTDVDVKKAINRLYNDDNYRNRVTNLIHEFDRRRELRNLLKETGEWLRKRKGK